MPYKIIFIISFIFSLQLLKAQNLISHSFIGSQTKDELNTHFGLSFIQYDVKYYKINYSTTDIQGNLDTVSGLLVVPDNSMLQFPKLVYQHGTSSSKANVPSNYGTPEGKEGDIPLFFGGMGYVSLAPDYLGLGDSDGFHPYVHAESEAWVALDFLNAFEASKSLFEVQTNNQLFITGYSQGGHAAMALHRALELAPFSSYEVTASAPMSGPYSIGGVMRNFILSDSIYYYPGYIPNTLLSYNEVYGNLFVEPASIFKAPYHQLILDYYQENIDLGTLNNALISALENIEGSCRPSRMILDTVRQVVANNPNHPINLAMKDNDVFEWAPEAPTRLLYCQADDQVPYMNSTIAADSMVSLGASDVKAIDVYSEGNHQECVEPAVTAAMLFFLGYQQIENPSFAKNLSGSSKKCILYPNPANNFIVIESELEGKVIVYNQEGKLITMREIASGKNMIDIKNWSSGKYVVNFLSPVNLTFQFIVID